MLRNYFLILLAVFLVVAGFKFELTNRCKLDLKGTLYIKPGDKVDNIFLGSSLSAADLHVPALLESLPHSYRLFYPANNPSFMLFNLQTLQSRGIKPKRLFLELNAGLFFKPEFNAPNLVWELSGSEKLKFIQSFHRLLGPQTLTELLLFADNDRFAYRFLAGDPLTGKYPISTAQDKNWSEIYRPGRNSKEFSRMPHMIYTSNRIKIRNQEGYSMNVDALGRIVELCDEQGIELYFWVPPLSKTEMESSIYPADEEHLRQMMVASGRPFITNQDVKFDTSRAEFFMDSIHLSTPGNREYTRLVMPFFLRMIQDGNHLENKL